jgi:hypothetical protein
VLAELRLARAALLQKRPHEHEALQVQEQVVDLAEAPLV